MIFICSFSQSLKWDMLNRVSGHQQDMFPDFHNLVPRRWATWGHHGSLLQCDAGRVFPQGGFVEGNPLNWKDRWLVKYDYLPRDWQIHVYTTVCLKTRFRFKLQRRFLKETMGRYSTSGATGQPSYKSRDIQIMKTAKKGAISPCGTNKARRS